MLVPGQSSIQMQMQANNAHALCDTAQLYLKPLMYGCLGSEKGPAAPIDAHQDLANDGAGWVPVQPFRKGVYTQMNAAGK